MITDYKILKKINQINRIIESHQPNQVGLINGICSQIIFYYQLNKIKPSKANDKRIIKKVELLLQKMEEEVLDDTFSYGLSGIIWTLQYIQDYETIDFSSVLALENDFYSDLTKKATTYCEQKNFDLFRGSVGLLLPIINSEEENIPEDQILKIFLQFDQNGMWQSHSNLNTNHYNFGLSHGIPSIIAILSILQNKVKEPNEENYNLVKRSIDFISSYKSTSDTLSLFPNFGILNKAELTYDSRLGWCYGDLGIANTFWLAGTAFNNENWKTEAIDIFLHAAKRVNLEENHVTDNAICHGTAGIAHIFNKIYCATKKVEFDEARNYWLQKTIEFDIYKNSFTSVETENESNNITNNYGLLEGLAGIGIVLMSFLKNDNENMEWDNCLLLSL